MIDEALATRLREWIGLLGLLTKPDIDATISVEKFKEMRTDMMYVLPLVDAELARIRRARIQR